MRSQLPLLLSDYKRRGTIGPKNGGGQNAPAKEKSTLHQPASKAGQPTNSFYRWGCADCTYT